jgi:PAS domain S-box-containing protein
VTSISLNWLFSERHEHTLIGKICLAFFRPFLLLMRHARPIAFISILDVKSTKEVQKRRRSLLSALSSTTPVYHLFDCIENVSFFAKDREGVLLAANQYLVGLYEFRTEAELIGHTDFDLLPRRLAEKFRRDDLQIMKSREPVTKIVEIFLNRQGIPSWFLTSKYPILSHDGKVLGVMGIIQDYHQRHQTFSNEQGLGRAMNHIHAHFREKIIIRDLAKLCQISLRQFERKFQSYFNLTPQQYIIKMRIHESCDLLSKQKMPIGEIAIDLGFYDQSSYTVQFKKTMGLTPLQYRKQFL